MAAVRDYKKLAADIKSTIGEQNIVSATHCATRLRLVLKQSPSDDVTKAISAMPGVIQVMEKGGQYQIVIGTHAKDVYAELAGMMDLSAETAPAEKQSFLNRVIAAMSGIFAPFVYILAAGGLIQGVLIIINQFAPAFAKTGTYSVLNLISWTPFVFLPVLIAITASHHFKCNTFVAVWCALALTGSPEALGGIGNTLPKDKIPSSYEYELFLINLETKEVSCLTRDFDPSVASYQWSEQDGMIYALCENRDLKSLYRINPRPTPNPSLKGRESSPFKGEIERVLLSEPYIYSSFSLAEEKPLLAYIGESSMSTDRCWLRDLTPPKGGRGVQKERLLYDLNPTRLKDIQLGECRDWNFKAERGDTIYGCYFLPPFFDETKQYPMLVYYYGGCSPVGRLLDSYYNFQEWAAMGYVVYLIQPSGCSGFGQEFASRHVNAYGDYTADDIIQGTKQFCKEHPFVKADKVGCMGASYGGFMTMYLQTVTDIFAAAMSHAGISNPASYWGFGYWGYTYSTTSAAHSYPWNNMELYSGHAPLFNADKVHTPILFMHGGADTNVPINESIQMFTALKLLGRECAFITVEGENHHILNYNKRIRWHDSIMAWFARWLQDDPTWWNTMYPEKNLK